MFRFAYPGAFILLIPPLIILTAQLAKKWPRQQLTLKYSYTEPITRQTKTWRIRLRNLPILFNLTAWILLTIALAQPQSGQSREVIRGQGIDIVLTLDISGSMRALDFAPQNRLQAAKTVINSFINEREFDRIGLVVFAQDAFQQTPLTLDYRALQYGLEILQPATDLGLTDGTAIGMGLVSAAAMLRQSNAASRIIVLLTDGVNNAGGLSPLAAAEILAATGIKVYAIGMGKPGLVPMPDDSGSIQMIESAIDESTLQAVAKVTQGLYFRAEDLTTLQGIYDQINRLERSDVERQVITRWQEQAGIFVLGALISLLTEHALRELVFQKIP
jgi:Ca-activated chloride channel family protein